MADKVNLKKEKGRKTAARIMKAARRLFSQKGYAHVSAEAIVEAAGVTRGALYHHFEGKKGLFVEIVKSIHKEIMLKVKQRTDQESDPFAIQIAGNDAFLEAASSREVRQILLIDAPAVLGWDQWRALDEEFTQGSYKSLLTILSERGLIKPVHVDALAHIISGAANEGVFYIAEAPDPQKALKEVQETMAQLIMSLKP